MTFLDKVKQSVDKAREGVSDLAATTKIRYEISNLNDRKSTLLVEIGRKIYALCQQGQGPAGVEAECRGIAALDEQIKQKSDEIARINAA
jgi:hypothetical protein